MPYSSATFWAPWQRHWCFVACLFIVSPIVGHFTSSNRGGVLFGIAFSFLAFGGLLWTARERKA